MTLPPDPIPSEKAAEDAVRRLTGVTQVTNSISVKPTVSASDIKKKIGQALARNAQFEAQAIRVSVLEGNKVSLEGKVDGWDDREVAENAAWSVAGRLKIAW